MREPGSEATLAQSASILPPELVDQLILRHPLVGAHEQESKQGTLPRRRDRDELAVSTDFQWTQDTELERSHVADDASTARSRSPSKAELPLERR